ncbi:MAG TPA: 50S ribosomal protein L17 [Euzebyales bacterium]|nr:50S ribosomal protein L17 [Euzebyales bacterium]
MPKPRKAGRFGRSPGHHNLMMANLATELFRHGRIRTTHAKAKTVQPIAERMITLAKRGDLHSRRQVLQVIRDQEVVHRLFADVGPAFSERNGGYTRVLRLGARKGDAAPMALIELVEDVADARATDGDGQSRRRWSLRRRREGPAGTTTPAAADDVDEDADLQSEPADETEQEDDAAVVEVATTNQGAVVPEIADEDDAEAETDASDNDDDDADDSDRD